jgi:hypothetical protein
VKGTNPDPWITILAGSKKSGTAITVRKYSEMIRARDRAGIAKLIRLRFSERYLDPVLHGQKRNGFAMLAIGCLMVEARVVSQRLEEDGRLPRRMRRGV